MMKRFLPLFVMIVVWTKANSQIVNYPPSDLFRPGDSCLYSFFTTTDSLYGADINYAGNDVTWDFSGIGMENQEVARIYDPLLTPFDTAYIILPDSATHATVLKVTELPAPPTFSHFFNINEGYNYFRLSAGAYSQIGLAANMAVPLAGIPATNVAEHFYEQETVFPFPLVYGAGDTNHIVSFLTVGPSGAFHSYKNKTVVVDGVGILITPYKTYLNALKVTSHAISVDTLWAVALLGPEGMPIFRQINDYYWMVPGYQFPVMHINEHIFDVNFQTVRYMDTIRPIPVYSVSLSASTMNLVTGDSAQLSTTILPVNASNTAVVWSSEDTSIVTVDQNGWVHSINTGHTRVFATSVQGHREGRCNVYVNPAGIDNHKFSNLFEIMPNPAGDYFTVTNNSAFRITHLNIYDIFGSIIGKFYPKDYWIQTDGLQSGIYFVEIICGQQRAVKKLIISR